MIIYYTSKEQEKLAFCTTGASPSSWTCLHSPLRSYNNLLYSKNHQLYLALTEDVEMETWDLGDPSSPKRALIEDIEVDKQLYPSYGETPELDDKEWSDKAISRHLNYLVPDESSQFFWIDRYVAPGMKPDGSVVDPTDDDIGWNFPYKTWTFDVYKFDLADKVLRHLEDSLEDHAIFIGLNQSFSVSAANFPGLISNSIYLADDYSLTSHLDKSFGGHYAWYL